MSNVQVMTREEEVLDNFASNIWRLSTDELKRVRQMIDAQLEILRQKKENHVRQQLGPGVRCKVNHSKGLGKVFVITKVNRTRVKAYVEGSPGLYGNYTIPISLLEIIG